MKRRRLLPPDSMGEVDRISHLPEPLIHHVMSYLPRRDWARISAVSPKFRDAWYSFPIVDYDISDWKVISRRDGGSNRRTIQAEKLKKFIEDVYHSLQFRLHDVSWQELRLHAPIPGRIPVDPVNVGTVMDELINSASARELVALALRKNVKSIDVYCRVGQFSLPKQLFSSRSITVLKLDGCQIEQPDFVIDRNFSVVEMSIKRCRGLRAMKGSIDKLLKFEILDCTGLNQIDISCQKLQKVEIIQCEGIQEIDIKASSLESFTFSESKNRLQPCLVKIESCTAMKKLTLKEALVTDCWIRDHLPKFPLLEVLELDNCHTTRDLFLKNASVFKVMISCCNGLENLIVMASNLEHFEYCKGRGQLPCKFDIRKSLYLKSLILYSACVTDRWLEFELPGLFPFLKHLKLSACGVELRNPKFSHPNLETLELSDCDELEEAEFRVPMLSSLVYCGAFTSTISVDAPRADVELFPKVPPWIMRTDDQIYVWLEHMRKFIGNFGHFNKLTLVCPTDKLLFFPEEFRAESLGSPLYDLRRLAVTITQYSSRSDNFVRVLDSLLWLAPRLNTISINFGIKEKTLKFLYDKSVSLELKDEFCCCRRGTLRCWRHYLTEVTMENFDDGFEKISLHRYFFKKSMRLNAIHSA